MTNLLLWQSTCIFYSGHYACTAKSELLLYQKGNSYFNASSSLPQLQTCFRLLSSLVVWVTSCLFINVLDIHLILTHTSHLYLVYSHPGSIKFHQQSSFFMIHELMKLMEPPGYEYQIQMRCQKEVGNHGINNNCLVYTSDGNTLKPVCNQDNKSDELEANVTKPFLES